MSDDLREGGPRVADVNVQTPAFEAYAAFKSEFDNSEHCAARTADRQRRIAVSSLPESELNKLSVVWLAEKQRELGRDITRSDLEGTFETSFDATMANLANNQFDKIKKAQWNPAGGVFLTGSKERDVITSGDIDKSLRKIEDQRQSMQYVDSLMSNSGELFYKLAKVHDGELSINYWDLKDARKADKKARDRGDKLFTDEERAAIDKMYDRWIHSHMRDIEHTPVTTTRAGQQVRGESRITLASMAKGTGFNDIDEMEASFNAEPTPRYDCATADHNQKVVDTARAYAQLKAQEIEQRAAYDVQKGDGFDKIARNVLTNESGNVPNEKDVVDFSSSIAKLNGFERQSYDPKVRSIHPGQKIQVRDANWKLAERLTVVGEVAEFVEQNLAPME